MPWLGLGKLLSVWQLSTLAAVCPLLGCGAPGPTGTPASCTAGSQRDLDCALPPPPLPLPPSCAADCTALDATSAADALATTAGLDRQQLVSRYPAQFSRDLGYDPLQATSLNLIAQTELALTPPETATLQKNGFLISARSRFPNFVYGYQTLYLHDLPVFVSADSIMHAVHRSYDDILASIEKDYLIGESRAMLAALHTRLAGSSGFSAEAMADADVYLAVARSLLEDQVQGPLAGGSAAAVTDLYNRARAAAGPASVPLFGQPTVVDFSQFTPRGHYTNTYALQHYFRSLMWLGIIQLPITTYDTKQAPKLNRRALEVAFILTQLNQLSAKIHTQNIDAVLRLFVGEPDNMTPDQLMTLMTSLGVRSAAELAAVPDASLLAALQSGSFGVQRIVSQILENGTNQTRPPPRVFLLLGQRYVADSHVLSNVVYDRAGGGTVQRYLPNPLDVAFAALGNNQAAQLLQPELTRYHYAPDLAAMRVLLDGHGADYWQSNLYTSWLGALRALSPTAVTAAPENYGLPKVAGTAAWGRRILGTQLASWAELRHDTILYAKPSYGSALCEFPDAYVDPYPRFYEKVATFADRGASGMRALGAATPVIQQAAEYFDRLGQVARTLEEMAELQRAHRPFTSAHLAFINEMVKIDQGCTGFQNPGWYLKLFWDPEHANSDPYPVADVATDPNSGSVLHVGTGGPRLLVVTTDTCHGPRSYFGLASSYYEVTTSNFQRLDDMSWGLRLRSAPPAEVPWLADLQ